MTGQHGDDEPFSMLQEACDSFEASLLPDDRTKQRRILPPQFADLWLVKLSELRGTLAEVRLLAARAAVDGEQRQPNQSPHALLPTTTPALPQTPPRASRAAPKPGRPAVPTSARYYSQRSAPRGLPA